MNSTQTASKTPDETRTEAQVWREEDAKFASDMRHWAVVGLIGVGVSLVLLANPIGVELAKGPSNGWNPEDATRGAVTVRTLGIMLFSGGLVERIVLRLENLVRPRSV